MDLMRGRNHLAVSLLLTVAVAASPAAADAADGAPAETSSWYGYQTLATDVAALGLALATDDDAMLFTAIGLYALGAPAVHALHRRPLAAVGSVALRVGLPLVLSAVAAGMADCSKPVVNDENCDFGPRIIGLGLGVLTAVLADSIAVAWEPKGPPPSQPRIARPASSFAEVSLSPVPMRGGAGLGFSGLF